MVTQKRAYPPAARKKGIIATTFREYWKHRYLFLLLLPGILYFVVFRYGPIYGLQIAFKNYRFVDGIVGSPWIGFENFQKVFMVKSFWDALKNTLILSFYKLVFGFPAPIIFALLMNEIFHMRYKRVVQTISYLPHFVSWVILGGLFIQFLSPSTGPINLLIKMFGGTPVYFLGKPEYFRGVLVVTDIWKGIGWGSIVYMAALSNVDVELYEAASIDGASRLHRMWHITLPCIMPIITIMLILQSGRILSDNFDQIYNLYNPAVYSVGDVLSTYNYRLGLEGQRFSQSAAVGLFTNIISFAMVLLTNAVSKRMNEYGIW